MFAVESLQAARGAAPGGGIGPAAAAEALALFLGVRSLLAQLLDGEAGPSAAAALLQAGQGALWQWLHHSCGFVGGACWAAGARVRPPFARSQQRRARQWLQSSTARV